MQEGYQALRIRPNKMSAALHIVADTVRAHG